MTMAAATKKPTRKKNKAKDPFGAFGKPTAPEAPPAKPKPKRKAKAKAKQPEQQQHSAAPAPSAEQPADPKPQPAEQPQPRGRPTVYTPELAALILFEIAEGQTLREICRPERPDGIDMPAPSTITGWVLDDREGFAARYARAREVQAWGFADEMKEIVDDGTNDWVLRQNPSTGRDYFVLNGEHVQRSKLRFEERRWKLSKMLPQQFGDKLELTGEALTKMPAADLETKFNTLLAAVEKRQAAAQPNGESK